ncbi:hypothetical protein AgCh_039270 [Apium graveolens]
MGLGIATVYVDDVILTGDDTSSIDLLKTHLDAKFGIKDLGQLHYFLGIEVSHTASGIVLCQQKFANELIAESGFDVSKPTLLFQFTSNYPTVMVMCILLHASDHLSLQAFSDADWASCVDTRRSVTRYILLFGTSPITWKSKKQTTISKSSAEAEYRAMASAAAEVTWVVCLLQELGVSGLKPVQLHCDNQSALHIARNPVFHERTKHIELDCHFTRDKVLEGMVSPPNLRGDVEYRYCAVTSDFTAQQKLDSSAKAKNVKSKGKVPVFKAEARAVFEALSWVQDMQATNDEIGSDYSACID